MKEQVLSIYNIGFFDINMYLNHILFINYEFKISRLCANVFDGVQNEIIQTSNA